MDRAVGLAELARGRTSPNPLVGAVVVKNRKAIGEGYHEKAGLPHAEVNALKAAARGASGATLYVTLEPCCNYGRTPPCTDVIINAGVRRVVVGLVDPNPAVSGKGVNILRESGLSVSVGQSHKQVARQNETYIKYITTGLPFMLMKSAISLDGHITVRRGTAFKLTGHEAQVEVHRLRSEYDAIMVGVDTIVSDNPQLTTRLVRGKSPLRVVVDSTGRLPLGANVVATAKATPTFVATAGGISAARAEALKAHGVEVLVCSQAAGQVDLVDLMRKLGERQVTSVIIEGGAKLNGAALAAGVVDKFCLFIAPMLISGPEALGVVESRLQALHRLDIADLKRCGRDFMVEAYPANRDSMSDDVYRHN